MSAKQTQTPGRIYERSTKGLRDMLFDALQDVTDGKLSGREAVNMAVVARQIVATCDLELRVQRQTKAMGGEADALTLAPPVVSLGRDATTTGG